MALFDDELQLYSDAQSAPPMSPLVMPDQAPLGLATPQPAGIGMGDVQAPAPVVDAGPAAPPLNRVQRNNDMRREAFERMSPGQKVFAGIGEFGAALQGKSSPLLAQAKAAREDRMMQLQELKVSTDAFQDGAKILEGLEGDQRIKFAKQWAERLNAIDPGLGDSFVGLADKPALITKIKDYEPYLSESMKLLMKSNPKEFMRFVGTEAGQKALEKAHDQLLLNGRQGVGVGGAVQKVTSIMGGLQQLVTPEQRAEFEADGRISVAEFRKINEELKAKKNPLALSDEQYAAALRAGDEFWAPFGILTPKQEQEVMKKKAEEGDSGKMKPGTVTDIPLGGKNFAKGVYDPKGTLFPDAEHDANGFAILGKGTKEGTTINMPSSSGFGVDPNTGKESHWTLGKDGKVRWDPIQPSPKPVNPIQAAVAAAIADAGKGKPAPKPGAGKAKPVASAVPAGIPAGSKMIGKSPDGKDVWEAPDGKKYVP